MINNKIETIRSIAIMSSNYKVMVNDILTSKNTYSQIVSDAKELIFLLTKSLSITLTFDENNKLMNLLGEVSMGYVTPFITKVINTPLNKEDVYFLVDIIHKELNTTEDKIRIAELQIEQLKIQIETIETIAISPLLSKTPIGELFKILYEIENSDISEGSIFLSGTKSWFRNRIMNLINGLESEITNDVLNCYRQAYEEAIENPIIYFIDSEHFNIDDKSVDNYPGILLLEK